MSFKLQCNYMLQMALKVGQTALKPRLNAGHIGYGVQGQNRQTCQHCHQLESKALDLLSIKEIKVYYILSLRTDKLPRSRWYFWQVLTATDSRSFDTVSSYNRHHRQMYDIMWVLIGEMIQQPCYVNTYRSQWSCRNTAVCEIWWANSTIGSSISQSVRRN